MPSERVLLERAADSLLGAWDAPGRPGCVVALLRGGAPILVRGFGRASIEQGVPNRADTVFRIASVTKQFVAGAVGMLAREGKLRLDDPLSRHLDLAPHLGERVTVGQICRNVSGLRDFLELSRLQGMDLDRPCSAEDLLATVRRQRDLNFAPTTRFLYCNTNFTLAGRLIEAVTGETLDDHLRRRWFEPAGMVDSRIAAATDVVLPRLATGYLDLEGGGFRRAIHAYPLGGEGGMASTLNDLMAWARAFRDPRIVGVDLAELLGDVGQMADGSAGRYGLGLFVGAYRGLRTLGHGGLWPGYRTDFTLLPERDLAVVTIANIGSIDPFAVARRLLDAVLDDAPRPVPVRARALPVGRFLDADGVEVLEITSDDVGQSVVVNGQPTYLVADGAGAITESAFERRLEPLADGAIAGSLMGAPPSLYRPVTAGPPPAGLIGRWRSEELDTIWTFTASADGALSVAVDGPMVKRAAWPVEGLGGDFFRVTIPLRWLPTLLDGRIARDASGAIDGFTISGGRARHLVFARVA